MIALWADLSAHRLKPPLKAEPKAVDEKIFPPEKIWRERRRQAWFGRFFAVSFFKSQWFLLTA